MADQQVAPGSTIEFYKSVSSLGPDPVQANRWVRLFMVPAWVTAAGGEGPDTFDALTALENWVEHGRAPDRIITAHATQGQVDRTRPLCAYPQVARYNGGGSINEAANLTCRLP